MVKIGEIELPQKVMTSLDLTKEKSLVNNHGVTPDIYADEKFEEEDDVS